MQESFTTSNKNVLTIDEVDESRKKYGTNKLIYKEDNGFWTAVKPVFKEPMIVLLLIAAFIYFISEKTGDGFFLLAAIILVATIPLYQDARSKNALEKLKNLTRPSARVLRDGTTVQINNEDVVICVHLIVEESISIVADGSIALAHNFSVNETHKRYHPYKVRNAAME